MPDKILEMKIILKGGDEITQELIELLYEGVDATLRYHINSTKDKHGKESIAEVTTTIIDDIKTEEEKEYIDEIANLYNEYKDKVNGVKEKWDAYKGVRNLELSGEDLNLRLNEINN